MVEMTVETARDLTLADPDLVIEEDWPLSLFVDDLDLQALTMSEVQVPVRVRVVAEADGAPVVGAHVTCVGHYQKYRGRTGNDGVAAIVCGETAIRHVEVKPLVGYWSKVVAVGSVAEDDQIDVAVAPLELDGGYRLNQQLLGLEAAHARYRGAGMRVAVVDSGTADHLDIDLVGGYCTLDDADPDCWDEDEIGHGTHCSGVIGAKLNDEGISGAAPECSLYSVKVFPGGFASDLIEAVDWCVENRMDVISMSLGGPRPSWHLHQAIQRATTQGITCVAAVGNESGPVSYPAAYPETIGVAAIGDSAAFPRGTAHDLRMGMASPVPGSTLFHAEFSNRGPGIDVCAPGVAVASTVPGGYSAWDGTSMATPFVSGICALIIEAHPWLRTYTSDQPAWVRYILAASSASLGFSPLLQGYGLPQAHHAVGMY